MPGAPEKATPNIVHQNAIWRETIRKETRCQKLYTDYHINPHKKIHNITGKPNSLHDTAEGEEDPNFLHIMREIRVEPRKKYEFPVTESQEIGWESRPLLDGNTNNFAWNDDRLRFPVANTDISKYKDAEWKIKEQMKINQG
ncbi:Oidioi.mRNA.OKI2018_I69.chr2.g6004.t1.cds [Oikopleura dioica]|uniref:Oidioi.mRNA.OKI2018_I69.chr2.g6004.t1.cds n=1 Tax=Oikopleura dioica TaxID=34765 RepID=A0ABN7TB40_OIKDI|nr:Oidioi.mRNA.OKI2018_I69.chr2.g6004.t1.cds [Oikopleura dioica]